MAKVNKDKCMKCGMCIDVCPFEAPFIGEEGKAEIEESQCENCGACVRVCPGEAIEICS
jgi:MinD superfamily P-loop ATPase